MKFLKVMRIKILLQSVAHYAVTLSTHAQFSQRDSRALSNQNSTECPSVWYEYNQVTHDCQCIDHLFLRCEGESVYADTHHILTYDSTREIISAVNIRHKYLEGYNLTEIKDGSTGILLPNNITELNSYMCGPLNREDYLCNKCKRGYGPPVISESESCIDMCYLCKDTWITKGFLLYLAVKFIPLTLFYLLILVFQIRLTSAPMTCLIMYSQLVVLGFYDECGLSESVFSRIKFTNKGNTLRTGTKIILNLYGVFNLDFFNYVLPLFCISSRLRPIHVFFLGYITVFYPFLLIILTWFCVELHGRNFRPIVWLWRPFHRCFVRLRRGWNTKSDLIDVFASFFLLSYSKILYLIMLTFDSEEIRNYSLMDGKESYDYVLSADLTTLTFNRSDIFLIFMVCFSLLFLSFVILPVFLLFFYPTRIFRSLLSKCLSSRLLIFLNTFMEKFHCSYKDGLDGTRDMRSLSGIYFLLRIIIYSAEAFSVVTLKLHPNFIQGFIFSVAALIIASSRPYKRKYMNIMDCILLFHMATFCYIIIASTTSLKDKPSIFLPMMQVMIAFPFIFIFLITIYRMTSGIFRKHFSQWSSLSQCSACLKSAKIKICGSFTSQNLTLPKTTVTYGTMN